MTTADCLQCYRNDVQETESFIAEAHILDASGHYVHPLDYRDFVISSAVVRFSIAWESFMENTYCSFLMGEPDTQGRSVPCCVTAADEKHAHQLLIGINRYFDWTEPDLIIRLSTLYLGQDNPIKTAIKSVRSDLMDIKTIRNAAAHISVTTQNKLDALASRLYGTQQINTTVASVVHFICPDGKTLWEYYKDLLDVAAENVVKGVV